MPSVLLDGVQLHYDERGAGRPLLLIHGTQPDGRIWDEVAADLARDHRVITYDRRGYSRSPHPPEPDFAVHASDAAALLRGLNAAPATVVGWSWGGLIALELSAAAPELAAVCVAVEPTVHLKRHPTWRLISTIAAMQILRRFGREQAAAEAFLAWACRRTTGGSSFNDLPAAQRDIIRRNAKPIVAEVDAGTGEILTMARVSAIGVPTTFIHGALSDPAFGNAVRRLGEALPHADIVEIPRAGHAVHFDDPTAFVAAVRRAEDLPRASTVTAD